MFFVFFRLFFCFLGFLYILGQWRLNHYKTEFSSTIIRLVQPCFAPLRKTDPQEDLRILLELSSSPKLLPGEYMPKNQDSKKIYSWNHHHRPHIVLWPEDAFPYALEEEDLQDMSQGLFSPIVGSTILIWEGILWKNKKKLQHISEDQPKVFNALFSQEFFQEERPKHENSHGDFHHEDDEIFHERSHHVHGVSSSDNNNTWKILHRKHHLVPFGEYLPLGKILKIFSLGKITAGSLDYSPGKPPEVCFLEKIPPFLPLICSEVMFPHLCGRKKALWIVNVSTDSWFFHSSGPYQNLEGARFRAIEQGLPLVRVSLSGISALVDPLGRLLATIPYGTFGYLDVLLPQSLPMGPYGFFGAFSEVFFFILWIFGLLFAWFAIPKFLFKKWINREKK